MSERTQRTILGVALYLFLSGHPSAHAQTNALPTTGNVGIGTLSPANSLSIRGSSFSYLDFGLGGTSTAVLGTDSHGSFIVFDPVASKYRLTIASTGDVGLFGNVVVEGQASVRGTSSSYLNFSYGGEVKSIIGTDANGRFVVYDPVGRVYRLTVDSSGGVKMGELYVTGSVRVDGNIAAKYQDVAEWVPTSAPLSPGTVVAIDPREGLRVQPTSRSYDPQVAGVVSDRPGIILGDGADDKVKVAHSGRVKVKVDAQYGSIAVGDLLVTSATPGHAMRSTPVDVGGTSIHRPGTLLGKALESLDAGRGEILVLLMLQ